MHSVGTVWTVMIRDGDESSVRVFQSEADAKEWVDLDMLNVMENADVPEELEEFRGMTYEQKEDYFGEVLDVTYLVESAYIWAMHLKICT
jgi:hypothetical protein